ncbi:hypothetical protein OAH12_02810, partial [Cyclobacteriaceae bacterium]|nr:hypothetical protein [Cyclobacteriaceae bacterium]
LLGLSMIACKTVEEEQFGPLKPVAWDSYRSLLIDTILDHNKETIKHIRLDSSTNILTVIYDEDKGNIDELRGIIERLDLIAPLVNDTLVAVKEEENRQAKLDTAIKEFIVQEVATTNNDEIKRLDSLRKQNIESDSTKTLNSDSTISKNDTIKKED